jgi:putative phosphoesterase
MTANPHRADSHVIGLISDTHGLLRPEVIRTFEGVELIVHAGDMGKPEVLESLRRVAPVVAVRGNVDRGLWARGLREAEVVEIGEVSLCVLHDLAMLDLDPGAAGLRGIIYGHSHRPLVERRRGVLYLNPGSAGPRRFTLPVSIALLRIDGTNLQPQLIEIPR